MSIISRAIVKVYTYRADSEQIKLTFTNIAKRALVFARALLSVMNMIDVKFILDKNNHISLIRSFPWI